MHQADKLFCALHPEHRQDRCIAGKTNLGMQTVNVQGRKHDTDQASVMVRIAAWRARPHSKSLFRSEAGRLIAVARRIVRRTDLAEEVVQDAFVAIWQRAAQFDPGRGDARGWITRIVRNRALNLICVISARVDHHDADTLEMPLAIAQAEANTPMSSCRKGTRSRRASANWTQTKRMSILLCYVTGLTHGEVAAKLDAPLGTVKAWIRRGMLALQECMG